MKQPKPIKLNDLSQLSGITFNPGIRQAISEGGPYIPTYSPITQTDLKDAIEELRTKPANQKLSEFRL